MDDLTDLEICQKIAEINGDNVTLQIPESCGCYLYDEDNEREYDPLTDDALWANLILTHEVSINFQLCQISMVRGKYYHDSFKDLEDLRRKSLELIIEAHK